MQFDQSSQSAWSILYPWLSREDPAKTEFRLSYKTFFMLNSAEHEIFPANKYENAN